MLGTNVVEESAASAFYSEDGCSKFLSNTGISVPSHITSQKTVNFILSHENLVCHSEFLIILVHLDNQLIHRYRTDL
jgi:hypothetical protein